MRNVVGFSLRIKRTWLDVLLDRLIRTNDVSELRAFLDEYLSDELPGAVYRDKTIGILLRIWTAGPPENVSIRTGP
jgi:hypothetical protein